MEASLQNHGVVGGVNLRNREGDKLSRLFYAFLAVWTDEISKIGGS